MRFSITTTTATVSRRRRPGQSRCDAVSKTKASQPHSETLREKRPAAGDLKGAVALPLLQALTAVYRQRNPSSGCSSTAFGATPVCPCWKSKKRTPVRAARQRRAAVLALSICRRRYDVALAVQPSSGASAIMWSRPSRTTTWRSPSSSWRISVTLATRRQTRRSSGNLVIGRTSGAGRLTSWATVVVRVGRRCGRSCSVFTVQRSTPHAARALAFTVLRVVASRAMAATPTVSKILLIRRPRRTREPPRPAPDDRAPPAIVRAGASFRNLRMAAGKNPRRRLGSAALAVFTW